MTTIPEAFRLPLEAGDFDAVEDAWLSHAEESPGDVTAFSTVARSLSRAGEEDRARFLLELVDETLGDAGRWEDRLELLRGAGDLLFEAGDLHPAIVDTMGRLFGGSPSYEALVEKVGIFRAVDDIPKIWKKVDRLRTLLGFDVGSVVFMDGKGAGKVVEVNMELESFKVELEHHGELRVGFNGAAKLLVPLPAGHLLRRKLEEPEVLLRLAEDDPPELLRAVLTSFVEPKTGTDVRRYLTGIVSDAKWTSWWSAARKHPQVIAAPGGRRAYSWASSTDHAQDTIWQSFESADSRTRLTLLRQNAERDPNLRERMSEALAVDAAGSLAEDPGLACEIWFGLEKSGVLPGEVPWEPATLIAGDDPDPRTVLGGIRDRVLRERTYATARLVRADWADLYALLLWQETEARSLDVLVEALDRERPEAVGSFFDQLLSQPRKSPAAFTWFAERAAERQAWMARNPLRLLKQILASLGHRDFSPFRGRLEPLADSGGTMPRLLSLLTEDQAAQAAVTLEKTTGLLDYQRRPLLTALHLRFPHLEKDREEPLYCTAEAIEAKRRELRNLAEVEIPANRRAIEEAREMGDLRENFEYKAARERHEYLSARANALGHDLERVRPIDPSTVDGSEVVIGARVGLEGDGGSRAITILGPWDSKPEEDILSNQSEAAGDLMGRKVGDQVELAGVAYRIAAIEPFR